jgi:homoserine dehydrogenase
MKERIGIGLMGLGVVAGQVVEVLKGKADVLARQVGCPVELVKVKVVEADLKRPRAKALGDLVTVDEDEFFETPGMDIVVEAIGGEKPALDYLKRAISSGRHVVTSNKEVVAKHTAELLALAKKNDVGLRCEAAVGGGIPLLSPFQYDLVANDIGGIYAIINGTTNYILTSMDIEGVEFEEALKQAQALGYAEADPENDIEGIDAAYKLSILASLAFKVEVKPQDIYREGISRLDSHDFRYARELGYAIKLLAIARQDNGSIEVRVHPAFVDESSFLAKVDGVYNAVLAEGDLVDKVMFSGQGAGPLPTSSAVVADVTAAARDIYLGVGNRGIWVLNPDKKVKPMEEVETRYYFRMNIADKSGVLAKVSTVFGQNDISISSAIQQETDDSTGTAEIVIMTHLAKEKAVRRALEGLKSLDVVNEVNNLIRVEIE